jgi:uncharacterized phage protein gp47/JayE
VPFARPTLTALRNQAVQDITTSGVPGLDGLLRNAVLRVLAWVMSGLAYGVYGYQDWTAKQGVPFTATDEFLTAWANLVGVYQEDATASTGSATFSGSIDTLLPVNTPLTRQDGTPYVTTAEGTTDSGGNVTVPIAATVTGAITNADAGTPIGINGGVPGINPTGTMGLTTGGADMESPENFRTRMLARYRNPPQGGSKADYEGWAMEVPGVTRAWAQPNGNGGGTVIVRIMLDEANAAYGGFPQGTDGCALEETRGNPASGDQLNVAEAIWPEQPVTALVTVMAPVALPIDVTLIDLQPDTEDIRTSIQAAIADLYLARAQLGGTIFPSDLYEAILATPGVDAFTMTEPALPVTALPGELPVPGAFVVQNA